MTDQEQRIAALKKRFEKRLREKAQSHTKVKDTIDDIVRDINSWEAMATVESVQDLIRY